MSFDISQLFRQGSRRSGPTTVSATEFETIHQQLAFILQQFPHSNLFLLGSTYKSYWAARFGRYYQYIRVFVIPDTVDNIQEALYEWNDDYRTFTTVPLADIGLEWRAFAPNIKGLCIAGGGNDASALNWNDARKERCKEKLITLPLPRRSVYPTVIAIFPSGHRPEEYIEPAPMTPFYLNRNSNESMHRSTLFMYDGASALLDGNPDTVKIVAIPNAPPPQRGNPSTPTNQQPAPPNAPPPPPRNESSPTNQHQAATTNPTTPTRQSGVTNESSRAQQANPSTLAQPSAPTQQNQSASTNNQSAPTQQSTAAEGRDGDQALEPTNNGNIDRAVSALVSGSANRANVEGSQKRTGTNDETLQSNDVDDFPSNDDDEMFPSNNDDGDEGDTPEGAETTENDVPSLADDRMSKRTRPNGSTPRKQNPSLEQEQQQQQEEPLARRAKTIANHAIRESGALLVNRKDAREAGVAIPVSRDGTCVADSLATIISTVWSKEECAGILLPDGSLVGPANLQKHLRDALSPNEEWTKLTVAEEFLPSLGFEAIRMTRDANGDSIHRNKVAVLTRTQGYFLVVCKLSDKDGDESTHAVSYLAEERYLVDNSAYQKLIELTNEDSAALVSSKRARKKTAKAIFKQRFGGAINEIDVWYEIVRRP